MTGTLRRRATPENGDLSSPLFRPEPRCDSKDSSLFAETPSVKNANQKKFKMKTSRKYRIVQLVWCLHFFLGFLVVYSGIVKNGGERKYVRIDPSVIASHCVEAYANVHSSGIEEPYALVCCAGDQDSNNKNQKWWSFLSFHAGSYEAALCSEKPDTVFGLKLSSFPSAWILPLIPLLLRMIIISYQRVLHKVPCKDNNAWSVQRRFILYFLVMNFRGWALYILLNNVEDFVVEWISSKYFQNNFQTSSTTVSGNLIQQSSTCWYQDYLYYENQRTKACYGKEFDFSDHVVLFFGQILPVAIFEVLFCFLVPLWNNVRNDETQESSLLNYEEFQHTPVGKADKSLVKTSKSNTRGENVVLFGSQALLVVGFLYLNLMTFRAVHHTAAYFHTASEVIVGYMISLCVQLPLGYIILHLPGRKVLSDSSVAKTSYTDRLRHLMGFPYKQEELQISRID